MQKLFSFLPRNPRKQHESSNESFGRNPRNPRNQHENQHESLHETPETPETSTKVPRNPRNQHESPPKLKRGRNCYRSLRAWISPKDQNIKMAAWKGWIAHPRVEKKSLSQRHRVSATAGHGVLEVCFSKRGDQPEAVLRMVLHKLCCEDHLLSVVPMQANWSPKGRSHTSDFSVHVLKRHAKFMVALALATFCQHRPLCPVRPHKSEVPICSFRTQRARAWPLRVFGPRPLSLNHPPQSGSCTDVLHSLSSDKRGPATSPSSRCQIQFHDCSLVLRPRVLFGSDFHPDQNRIKIGSKSDRNRIKIGSEIEIGSRNRIEIGSKSDRIPKSDQNRIEFGSKSDRNRIEIGSKSDQNRIEIGSKSDQISLAWPRVISRQVLMDPPPAARPIHPLSPIPTHCNSPPPNLTHQTPKPQPENIPCSTLHPPTPPPPLPDKCPAVTKGRFGTAAASSVCLWRGKLRKSNGRL